MIALLNNNNTLAIVLLIYYTVVVLASNSSLQCESVNCTCSGSTLVFECTNAGAIATVWRGSFFDCPSNSIVLRHRLFQSGINGTCSNGAIVARSIEALNNSYTSQLSVTVSQRMKNGSVECIRDSSIETTIGTCPLNLATGKHRQLQVCSIEY